MKKTTFLLGLITGFLLFPLAADLSQIKGGWVDFLAVPGYGTTEAFSGNCTKDISRNGHGAVFVNREYFGCGKVNVLISDLIYGEYEHGQPTEKRLKALSDFKTSGKLQKDD